MQQIENKSLGFSFCDNFGIDWKRQEGKGKFSHGTPVSIAGPARGLSTQFWN
jgi:hypothetical protein